jgi:hypothetical protein
MSNGNIIIKVKYARTAEKTFSTGHLKIKKLNWATAAVLDA